MTKKALALKSQLLQKASKTHQQGRDMAVYHVVRPFPSRLLTPNYSQTFCPSVTTQKSTGAADVTVWVFDVLHHHSLIIRWITSWH